MQSKDFIKKLHKFTNNNFRLAICRKNKKNENYLKSKIKICIQRVRYIMENVNIAEIITLEKRYKTVTRWYEHNKPDHKSEPAEHIKRNIDCAFNWKILCPVPSQKQLNKNLEAIFIVLYESSLNGQKYFEKLMLFRNDIT